MAAVRPMNPRLNAMNSKKKGTVQTWFNRIIRETIERETVSEETVIVQQQVYTENRESVTVDCFRLYPSLLSE